MSAEMVAGVEARQEQQSDLHSYQFSSAAFQGSRLPRLLT